MEMDGGSALLKALEFEGVDVVFGYPGGAVLPIYDEIFLQNDIRHILVRHEQGAAHMAEGYARSTGKPGVGIMSDSVQFVILVVALGTYSYIGAMGAAAFGAETQGDIMMNDLVHTHNADLAFVIAMLVYLASCIPPLVISLRSYLAFILAGPRAPLSRRRFLALTVSIIALPLALVWRDPSMSETAFSLTGATGVCIVCYVIPVIVHLRLLFRLHAGDGGAQEPLAGGDAERRAGRGDVESGDLRGDNVAYAPKPSSATAWVVQVAWPLLVLVVGCMLSGLALYTALYGH